MIEAGKLLLHCCCGPCATYTVRRLREEAWGITGFWYNPNVQPFLEHQERLASMTRFAQAVELPLMVSDGYDLIRYFRLVVGCEAGRCEQCYRLRLGKAAEVAQQEGFEAFATTLMISPYQDHDLMRAVGREMGQEHRVDFFYEDLRSGFGESRRLSREMGLYRQKYCGCVYSEWERYGKVRIGERLFFD